MYYKLNTYSSTSHANFGFSNLNSNLSINQKRSFLNPPINNVETIYPSLPSQLYSNNNNNNQYNQEGSISYINSNVLLNPQKISQNIINQNLSTNYSQPINNSLYINTHNNSNYQNVRDLNNNFIYMRQPAQNTTFINSSNIGSLYQNSTTNYSAGVIFYSNNLNKNIGNFGNFGNTNLIYLTNPQSKIENPIIYSYPQSNIFIQNSNYKTIPSIIPAPQNNLKRSITPINTPHHIISNDFNIFSPLDVKKNNIVEIQKDKPNTLSNNSKEDKISSLKKKGDIITNQEIEKNVKEFPMPVMNTSKIRNVTPSDIHSPTRSGSRDVRNRIHKARIQSQFPVMKCSNSLKKEELKKSSKFK